MTLTFETIDQDPVWVVKVTGTVTSVEDLESIEYRVRDVALREYVKRIMLDETAMTFGRAAIDISLFATQAGERDLAIPIRVACLASEDNLELNKAFEADFEHRSVTFKVFEDERHAYSWLMG